MGFSHRSQIEQIVRNGRDCWSCHRQDRGRGPMRRERAASARTSQTI